MCLENVAYLQRRSINIAGHIQHVAQGKRNNQSTTSCTRLLTDYACAMDRLEIEY